MQIITEQQMHEVRWILTQVHDRIVNNPEYLQHLLELNNKYTGRFVEHEGVMKDRRLV